MSLVSSQHNHPIKVFIAYSKSDTDLREALEVHLAAYVREGLIEIWHDQYIEVGENKRIVKQSKLEEADIILLLITPIFLASEEENVQARESYDEGKAKIIPIILKPCSWRNDPFLSKLQVLPRNEEPISQVSDRDSAFLSVVQEIGNLAKSIMRGNLDEKTTQSIREYARKKIEQNYSQIYLLNGGKVNVEQLYVDVWLLDKPEKTTYNTPESLLKKFSVEQDRLALSKRMKRDHGFTVAEKNSKLIIFGKPGSGKTTFLKHLAANWNNETFQKDCITVIIELRQINGEKWDLIHAIDQELNLNNWPDFSRLQLLIGKAQNAIDENLEDIPKLRQIVIKNKNDVPQLNADIRKLDEEIPNLKMGKLEIEQKASRLEIEKDLLQKEIEDILKKAKRGIKISKDEKDNFENLKKDFDRINQDALNLKEDLEVLTLNIPIKEEKLDLLNKELSRKEREIKEFPSEILKKEKELDYFPRFISKMQKELESLPLQILLRKGMILLLLDGFDEVPQNRIRTKVQEKIIQVSEEYPENRYILTCRTQVMAVIPDRFVAVEVADFNSIQVENFIKNWSQVSCQSSIEAQNKSSQMIDSVMNTAALRELAGTPVLLSLMCLVFFDAGEMPSNRTWLYQKGVNLLLSRWNSEKQIENWELNTTYRDLSTADRAHLLAKIAAHKFENPRNFVLFDQVELVNQIIKHLNLADREKGEAILKAIEAQHGLLIERADKLWSFSHLTFQEYFTVQWLSQLSHEDLVLKIANSRWQEVVKQLVKSQQPADRLISLIQQSIERSVANEAEIQKFLRWLCRKSASIQSAHNPTAIRAFYYALALANNRADEHTLTCIRDRNSALAIALDPSISNNPSDDLNLDLALEYTLDHALDFNIEPRISHAQALSCALNRALEIKFVGELQEIKLDLPETNNLENFCQWWDQNNIQWIERLRQVMISTRNIGIQWETVDYSKLQYYYDSNKFLAELLRIDGAVSDSCRHAVENIMLLPWQEGNFL